RGGLVGGRGRRRGRADPGRHHRAVGPNLGVRRTRRGSAGTPRPAGAPAVHRAVRADAVRRRDRRPAGTGARPGDGTDAHRRGGLQRPGSRAAGTRRGEAARPVDRAWRGAPGGLVTLARLHPLTPVLRSARTLAVIIAGVSWQGYASLGVRRW